jgi:peptidoglycan/LPS O-acetylase OafA/YrhL
MRITAAPASEHALAEVRFNNFDLIRVFAAFQVLDEHAIATFKITALHPLMHALQFFPGVPIFFVVSGFLVSLSWSRAPSARQYALNRALRIFPGLWVCLAVSILIALACGAWPSSAADLASWLAAQGTVFQFYNPEFLRGLPTGGLNGSLWTIPVELQFYILLPVLAVFAKDRWQAWLAFSVAAAIVMMIAQPPIVTRATMGEKLLSVSVVPYLFYFLVGAMALRVFQRAPSLFRGKVLHWGILYLAWIGIEVSTHLDGWGGNLLSVPTILLLGGLTVAAAFTLPSLAGRLLREHDLSYGMYIYHVPLINLLLVRHLTGGTAYVAVVVATSICAFLSWHLIERPALRLKRYSSRRPVASRIESTANLVGTG